VGPACQPHYLNSGVSPPPPSSTTSCGYKRRAPPSGASPFFLHPHRTNSAALLHPLLHLGSPVSITARHPFPPLSRPEGQPPLLFIYHRPWARVDGCTTSKTTVSPPPLPPHGYTADPLCTTSFSQFDNSTRTTWLHCPSLATSCPSPTVLISVADHLNIGRLRWWASFSRTPRIRSLSIRSSFLAASCLANHRRLAGNDQRSRAGEEGENLPCFGSPGPQGQMGWTLITGPVRLPLWA
jgi:hypothetical protein